MPHFKGAILCLTTSWFVEVVCGALSIRPKKLENQTEIFNTKVLKIVFRGCPLFFENKNQSFWLNG